MAPPNMIVPGFIINRFVVTIQSKPFEPGKLSASINQICWYQQKKPVHDSNNADMMLRYRPVSSGMQAEILSWQ